MVVGRCGINFCIMCVCFKTSLYFLFHDFLVKGVMFTGNLSIVFRATYFQN